MVTAKGKLALMQILFFFIVVFCGLYPQNINATNNILGCPIYMNDNVAVVTSYKRPAVGSLANISTNGSGTNGSFYRDFITLGNSFRFRQSGNAKSVKLFFQNPHGYASGMYIKVRRKMGTNFNLIATSENILPSLGAASGVYTVYFSNGLNNIKEGDYYGYRIVANLPAVVINKNFLAAQPVTAESGTNFVNQSTIGTTFNWETSPLSNTIQSAVPMEFTMNSPDVVLIGDSIIAGHPAHYSYIEKNKKSDITSTVSFQLGSLTSYVTQNLGIGGQTTTQIAARFTGDALGAKPKIIIIEGGVNDVASGVPQVLFTAKVRSMLNAAQNDPGVAKVILLGILPWTNGTNMQNTTVDIRNGVLANMAAAFSKTTYVSATSAVGKHRPNGAAGNLRNIHPDYNVDGVHYNSSGHARIAQVLRNALCPDIIQ